MLTAPSEPASTEIHLATMDDGAEIAFRRWGSARDRRVIISHGNGLAIDAFREFGEALAKDFEVVAFDLRNHGRSPRRPHPADPWPRTIADIPLIFDAIAETFGAKETHGALHSMSAASTLIAQSLTPRPWASLTLIEPPLPPSDEDRLEAEFNERQETMAARARRRRASFASVDQLAQSFARAPTFFGLSDTTRRLLAEASLLRTGAKADEPYELVLTPEAEARNFEAGILSTYWAGLKAVDVPVQILVGDETVHDMPNLLRMAGHLSKTFGYGRVTVPGTNHFMQLQKPDLCATNVTDFVARLDAERV